MSNENKSESLIVEIKASEKTASELVEKAGKISAERLKSIEKGYEKRFADLEARFKQDKIDAVQKALKHASEQKDRRKRDINKTIRFLEQRVREKQEQAVELIMQKIMGISACL